MESYTIKPGQRVKRAMHTKLTPREAREIIRALQRCGGYNWRLTRRLEQELHDYEELTKR